MPTLSDGERLAHSVIRRYKAANTKQVEAVKHEDYIGAARAQIEAAVLALPAIQACRVLGIKVETLDTDPVPGEGQS